MTTLDRLQAWVRKGRSITAGSSGFYQPGDQFWIRLRGGYRDIIVGQDDEGRETFSIEDCIRTALDEWDAKDREETK